MELLATLEADHEGTALKVTQTNKGAFIERYRLNFRDENTITWRAIS